MAVRAVGGAVPPERDAARRTGSVGVPPARAQELGPAETPPGAARLLAHVETDLPTSRIAHVHPGAATALRKDIAQ